MGEARLPRRDVADGVDATVAGLHLAVHGNAAAVMANARGREAEAVSDGLAPGCDEQMRAADVFFLAVRLDGNGEMADRMGDARDFHARANDDPIALKRVQHDGG